MALSEGEGKVERHCAQENPGPFLIFFRLEQVFGNQVRNFLFIQLEKTYQVHFLNYFHIDNAVFKKLLLPLFEKLLKHGVVFGNLKAIDGLLVECGVVAQKGEPKSIDSVVVLEGVIVKIVFYHDSSCL